MNGGVRPEVPLTPESGRKGIRVDVEERDFLSLFGRAIEMEERTSGRQTRRQGEVGRRRMTQDLPDVVGQERVTSRPKDNPQFVSLQDRPLFFFPPFTPTP